MPVVKKRGSKKRGTNKRKKSQRMYNMKGCSKTKCVKRKRRYLGLKGGSSAAYPLMTQPPQNDFLNSLHGGGFSSCGIQGGGCSSCGGQMGGTCNQCGLVGGCYKCGKNKKGGNPFVGKAWESNDVNSWPGVDGSAHGGNHYELNKYPVDLQTSMIVGGKKRRHKTRKIKKQRGAGVSNMMQQDLTNMMRQVTTGFGSAYNTLNGFPPPVSPMPTEGQLLNR